MHRVAQPGERCQRTPTIEGAHPHSPYLRCESNRRDLHVEGQRLIPPRVHRFLLEARLLLLAAHLDDTVRIQRPAVICGGQVATLEQVNADLRRRFLLCIDTPHERRQRNEGWAGRRTLMPARSASHWSASASCGLPRPNLNKMEPGVCVSLSALMDLSSCRGCQYASVLKPCHHLRVSSIPRAPALTQHRATHVRNELGGWDASKADALHLLIAAQVAGHTPHQWAPHAGEHTANAPQTHRHTARHGTARTQRRRAFARPSAA